MLRDLYDGVPAEEIRKSAILSARALIEKEPAYSFVTARLLLDNIRHEVLGEEVAHEAMQSRYADYFSGFVQQGLKPGCWMSGWASLIWRDWRKRWRQIVICSSAILVCKPCMTATFAYFRAAY